MYTKSYIQQTVEALQVKSKFKSAIESLMDKYNIEDSVFVFVNNSLKEVVEGYFVTEHEFDNLNEAISACDVNSMGIRIVGNTFQVGNLHNKISECAENKKVFDLKRLVCVK